MYSVCFLNKCERKKKKCKKGLVIRDNLLKLSKSIMEKFFL